ncbi:MAG: PQQ-dependent sugar dehydrogenase [Candidatus Methylacidiphilales bacterium]|nr:PQQ-dependent sugar dehydrogenase [Candidatus Methylacidiphilales bacterium]
MVIRTLLLLTFGLASSLPAQSEPPVQTEDYLLRRETLVTGLTNAWAMVKLPDGRLLITEKAGKVRVVQNNQLLPEPVANIPEVDPGGQGGLLDIELHPDYPQNGWIYLAYSRKKEKGSLTNIVRARLKDNALTDIQPVFDPPDEDYVHGGIHFGCRLEFDKQGYLYFSHGDRGDKTTPENRAQRLDHIGGKIHRLHDDGRIPDDNPFVKTPGARPSIWSYGNRNPQGLRFHPVTGDLWSTEHGPRGGDELNLIKKGANYGWPLACFGINYNGTPITDKTEIEGMESPVTHWTPSIAVSAIDFYTGDQFPKWKNNLLVGSLAHQKLIRIVLDGQNKAVHEEILVKGGGRIRDIHCWDDVAIHVLYTDKLVRLVPE